MSRLTKTHVSPGAPGSGTFRRTLGLRAVAATAALPLLLTACGGTDDGVAEDGTWAPTQAIEITAPAATGGGWDTLARTSARLLEEEGLVDHSPQVVNKPGAGGAIGWGYIANNAGDPHKLFVTSPPILLVPMAGDSDHDHNDFTPIARLATDYMVYLVAADSDIETFADLAGQVESGDLSVGGGSGPGSMDHVALAGALQAAGADATQANYIPFDGGGEALTSLLGGHVDAAVVGVGEALGMLESGDLRAVGVSSAERLDAVAEVPTLVEQDVDFTFDIWRGVMGPADLTEEQIAYHETLFADLMETEAWKEESARLGWTDAYQDSEEFGTFLDDTRGEFAEILTEVGLQ
ncbi:tripartite tricarboxylate transporter substrate binding protein [Nocardiopsis lambiniae]|uniref:Tripartite tricarboxylate transporter substrate binding protein n=1 Tax=Nocardiopsis lambiniae TaxID=3075539 RepID=A0ABU2M8C4_9ACTN|nr:tripartite tricarboxylate transporter substrate binding protein [Nocardiopsis sp. DSM 44743]MDT0328415.1 tripartite tricarboxylate transporter substrate binding protein [Nocardiopsis sp. DSM 44743]